MKMTNCTKHMEIIQKHSFKPFIKQSCNFIALRKGFFETVWEK